MKPLTAQPGALSALPRPSLIALVLAAMVTGSSAQGLSLAEPESPAAAPPDAAVRRAQAVPDGLAPGEAVVPAESRPAAKPPARTVAAPPQAAMPAGLGFDPGAPLEADTERVVYRRAPVRVLLKPGVERIVGFPGPVALHVPDGMDELVRIQIIERTAYLRATAPFGPLRVVAEDLITGRQIPLDIVADAKTPGARAALEVQLPGTDSVVAGASGLDPVRSSGVAGPAVPQASPNLDMVALTRFASQSLYAPRRLIPVQAGVRSIPVRAVPVDGLYRGWRVRTTPVAAWRSGQLYVTAVAFQNDGGQAHDIDPDDIRGQWLAATPQHRRLLPGGTDWSSTTVYLICDRPFEACKGE